MIILDIESSGTNPQKHSILSIGAIDFLEPRRTFYRECKIWPGANLDDQALSVNGFTLADIERPDKKTEREIVKEFLAWALESENHTIAGQNPFFDLFFVQAAAERAGLNFPLAHRLIDLHSVCYFHMFRRGMTPPVEKGRSGLNSDLIMDYIGLPAEPKPHNALNGAKWETEAFYRLFYDKPLFAEFEKFEISWVKIS